MRKFVALLLTKTPRGLCLLCLPVGRLALHEEIMNINRIRTRKHGAKVFVDIKLFVNPSFTILKGDTISHDIEDIVYKNVENVKEVLISINPCKNPKNGQCLSCNNSNVNKFFNR